MSEALSQAKRPGIHHSPNIRHFGRMDLGGAGQAGERFIVSRNTVFDYRWGRFWKSSGECRMNRSGFSRAVVAMALGALITLAAHEVAYATEFQWIEDTRTGCQIFETPQFRDVTINWSGNCVAGKAQGGGILIWYRNGLEYFRSELSEERGVVFVAGRKKLTSAAIEAIGRHYDLKCTRSPFLRNTYNSSRSISVDVSSLVDLTHGEVAISIAEIITKEVWQRCPAFAPFSKSEVNLSGVTTKIFQKNTLVAEVSTFPTRVGPSKFGYDKPVWGFLNNFAFEKAKREGALVYEQGLQRRREEEKRRKQLAQKKAEDERRREKDRQEIILKNRKMKSKAKFDEFNLKYKIASWPNIQEFDRNPFVFEGDIVGLVAKFGTMVSKDAALFQLGGSDTGLIFVTDVPAKKFKSVVRILLAARVTGKRNVKIPLSGEISIPQVSYIDAHICGDDSCEEVLLWQR